MLSKIFVYGTLHDNPGNRYSRFLEQNAKYIGVATRKGKLFNIGRYPGAVESLNPDDMIKGYLYSTDNMETLLSKLDEYEGYEKSYPAHSLFIRKKVLVADKKNKKHWAWMYLYNKDVSKKKEIDEGDFFTYRLKNNRKAALHRQL